MSLLLDALKKAAKDKEQATESTGEPMSPETDDIELTLDEENSTVDTEEMVADTPVPPEIEELKDESKTEELTLEQREVRSTTATVSDEALQMLVHKTNAEHRRKQKIVWLGVAAISVFVLSAGGYYFYSEMTKDVESLELKHQIAIRKVNAEVIKRKDPKLIADLVQTEEPTVNESASTQSNSTPDRNANVEPVTRAESSAVSANKARPITVRKTVKEDPVSKLLNDAWDAYNKGDTTTAARLYDAALKREPGNRDALLGKAAIAISDGQFDVARESYEQVLRLDPRDPVAVPALAGLQQSVEQMGESKLKGLLKQRPQAAHISFALGNIKAEQKQWPEAQSYYFKAWQNDEMNADYAFNLAISLEHIGQPAQAARFYDKSIVLSEGRGHNFSIDVARDRLQALSGEE